MKKLRFSICATMLTGILFFTLNSSALAVDAETPHSREEICSPSDVSINMACPGHEWRRVYQIIRFDNGTSYTFWNEQCNLCNALRYSPWKAL